MDLALDAARVADALDRVPADMARESIPLVGDALRDEAARRIGGDRRMRNVAWQTWSLDVESGWENASASHSSVRFHPWPARGGSTLWAWLEDGTKGHDVGRPARSGRRKRMRLPDGSWRTGPWTVRGMAAGHSWTAGIDAAEAGPLDRAMETILDEVDHG